MEREVKVLFKNQQTEIVSCLEELTKLEQLVRKGECWLYYSDQFEQDNLSYYEAMRYLKDQLAQTVVFIGGKDEADSDATEPLTRELLTNSFQNSRKQEKERENRARKLKPVFVTASHF